MIASHWNHQTKTMTDLWNAKAYSQFLDVRTRPARDLLAAIPPHFVPGVVYDLGCGPGNSTVLLTERWPQAKIIGIDSSEDMLKEARVAYPHIQFIKADIANFAPSEKGDCLFANASLQWLDHHDILIPKLAANLNKQGMLAIQMPNNFHAPSHQVTICLLQNHPAWQPCLKALRYGALTSPFYELKHYYGLLTKTGLSNLQLWETEYYQEMANHEAIFDWVKGTGLRPVLARLTPEDQEIFRQEYIHAISKIYPIEANGKVVLAFRRVFMVGEVK